MGRGEEGTDGRVREAPSTRDRDRRGGAACATHLSHSAVLLALHSKKRQNVCSSNRTINVGWSARICSYSRLAATKSLSSASTCSCIQDVICVVFHAGQANVSTGISRGNNVNTTLFRPLTNRTRTRHTHTRPTATGTLEHVLLLRLQLLDDVFGIRFINGEQDRRLGGRQ